MKCMASVVAVLSMAGAAAADDEVVASLPWKGGQTAGPNATDFEPPDDAKDLWVVEDFGVAADTRLGRFESIGTIHPGPPIVHDVTVRIYDGFPPEGNLVLSSIPGEGLYESKGFSGELFITDFGGQLLPAGDYWLTWSVATASQQGKKAILWAQAGAHKTGGGQPDNAFLWNPGGFWGFENNYKKVPADLDGNGQTGVNFTLFGEVQESCYPDFTGDGVLDLFDFLEYVNAFNAADPGADCTGEGTFDLFDFLCFVNAFNAGC
jgi:hypothetical protein